MNRGLQLTQPIRGDYVFGSSLRLRGDVIQPDGQWDAYCPPDEVQNLAMEPMACATFGTLNAIEILERQEFGDTTNWSDRFLAEISGTTQYGNDPHTVAETLRKKGDVPEADWEYTPDINTWAKFYDTPPQNLYTLAKAFTARYDFGHEYVGTDPQSMMGALKCSPLGADVYAWNPLDTNGIYHRFNQPSDHWVCIYGYVPNEYWKCFDSYTNTHKKLSWDFGFTMVKRYTLHKQVINETAWDKFLYWLRTALGLNTMFGAERSADWSHVRRHFIAEHPLCAVCYKPATLLKPLNVHHIQPFHIDPTLELNPQNLITLCRDHHFLFGHLLNWKSWNTEVEMDSRIFHDKIKSRP